VAFKSPNSKLLNSCVHFQVDKNFNNKKHVIDYYHDLTNKIGMPVIGRRINFRSSKSELRKAYELLQSSPLKACELIIGVKITGLESRSYRDWPTENFLQLARLLTNQYSKIGFILLGGLNEYNKNEKIAENISAPVLNMSGAKLREIGAIMKYINLYIGVDTGFTQLVSSYDNPMVVLYHPFIPKYQTQPINHPNFHSIDCHEKSIINMNKENMMETISAERVFEKITMII
jgi:ADP-heptose:LPS heptosyltransferase